MKYHPNQAVSTYCSSLVLGDLGFSYGNQGVSGQTSSVSGYSPSNEIDDPFFRDPGISRTVRQYRDQIQTVYDLESYPPYGIDDPDFIELQHAILTEFEESQGRTLDLVMGASGVGTSTYVNSTPSASIDDLRELMYSLMDNGPNHTFELPIPRKWWAYEQLLFDEKLMITKELPFGIINTKDIA